MTIHKLWLRSNLLQLGYRPQFKLSRNKNKLFAEASQPSQELLCPTIESVNKRLNGVVFAVENESPKQLFIEVAAGEKHAVLILHYLLRNQTGAELVYRLNQAFELQSNEQLVQLNPLTGELSVNRDNETIQYKTKIESDGKMKLAILPSKKTTATTEAVKTRSAKLNTEKVEEASVEKQKASEPISEPSKSSTEVMTPQSRQETLKSRLLQLENQYTEVRQQIAIVRAQLVLAEIQQQAQSRPWQPLPTSVLNEAELLSYLITTRHSKTDVIDLTARRLAAVLGLEFQ